MLDEYNYTETESGRSETLVQAIDRIEILERKLSIATHTLHDILWHWSYDPETDAYGVQKALKEIENVR